MGISIQYCSCLRNPKDEKISEFQPQLNDNNPENKKKNKNILEFYPISTTVNSVNTEEKEKEKFFESKQFSFKASYSNDTLSKQDIIKMRTSVFNLLELHETATILTVSDLHNGNCIFLDLCLQKTVL